MLISLALCETLINMQLVFNSVRNTLRPLILNNEYDTPRRVRQHCESFKTPSIYEYERFNSRVKNIFKRNNELRKITEIS